MDEAAALVGVADLAAAVAALAVVVRINDRGPFHSTRIIDVSYTAALKLGLLGNGSYIDSVGRRLHGTLAELLRLARWLSFAIR